MPYKVYVTHCMDNLMLTMCHFKNLLSQQFGKHNLFLIHRKMLTDTVSAKIY